MVFQKENHLLREIMDHPVMAMAMIGCQEQMMVGDPRRDGAGQHEIHHTTSEWHVI